MEKLKIAVLSSSYGFDGLTEIYDPIFLGGVNELFALSVTLDAILIDYNNNQKIYDCLVSIKSNQSFYLLPIFTRKNIDNQVLDGQLSDESYDHIKTIHKLSKELDLVKIDWQSRLLYFLYTRPSLKLKPSRNIKNLQFFSYDAINIFAENFEVDAIEYLNRLCDDQVLQKTKLIQTLFTCQKCLSAHVYFSDHCPNCDSLEIEYCDFIHCYSCGNISPEKEYIYQNKLKCPNCHSLLKHISVEYDQPLESYQCHQCNHQFEEPKIQATCMSCNHAGDSNELAKTYFHEYQLTEFGRKYIYENQDFALNIFDKINFVKPNVFYQQAKWLLLMQERDKCFAYSLIYFKIGLNIDRYRIQEIAKILKDMLRGTDILTRINERFIWLILPNTSTEDGNLVIKKIQDRILETLEIRLEIFCLASKELKSILSIKDLMEQYSEGLE